MENFIKEVEVDGVSHSITLGDNMVGPGLKKDENGVVSLDINEEKLVKITYSELKSLRNNSQLTPGSFYRITDYVTTTTQSETKSANHPFDVIVLALSENTLCEDAKAILHEGDTYFADSDLSTWELKYYLDNDKTRFGWADETNGKGVIYRMIDEKLNDCPYDFKNILFYNTKFTDSTTSDNYYYTFSCVVAGGRYDGTTEKQVGGCFGNMMKEKRILGKLLLNNNVFRITFFKGEFYRNTFGRDCSNNTFENGCCYNTLGDGCYSNTFGSYCRNNTFGDNCIHNTFSSGCNNNIFRDYCQYNEFGRDCDYNIFQNCQYNSFEDKCSYNTFWNNRYRKFDRGSENIVITLNEEFYDDGNGQVVPIKHPDLSTQPSILPYKFMGQYVYEQLVPVDLEKYNDFYIGNIRFDSLLNFTNRNGMVLSAYVITTIKMTSPYEDSEYECRIPINAVVTIATKHYDNVGYTRVIKVAFKIDEDSYKLMSGVSPEINTDKAIVKIIYTSMPEEGGDYYGYE